MNTPIVSESTEGCIILRYQLVVKNCVTVFKQLHTTWNLCTFLNLIPNIHLQPSVCVSKHTARISQFFGLLLGPNSKYFRQYCHPTFIDFFLQICCSLLLKYWETLFLQVIAFLVQTSLICISLASPIEIFASVGINTWSYPSNASPL